MDLLFPLVCALQCANPCPSYFLAVVILTLLPAREVFFFILRLVMPCTTGVAPLLSLYRGFGTSLLPHGRLPIMLVGSGWFSFVVCGLAAFGFSVRHSLS